MEEALEDIRNALEVYQQSSESYWLPIVQRCTAEWKPSYSTTALTGDTADGDPAGPG
jgi:hypothetical protein